MQHISKPVSELLAHKPRVDTQRLRQAIERYPEHKIYSHIVADVLNLVDWLEQRIETLEQRKGGEE